MNSNELRPLFRFHVLVGRFAMVDLLVAVLSQLGFDFMESAIEGGK